MALLSLVAVGSAAAATAGSVVASPVGARRALARPILAPPPPPPPAPPPPKAWALVDADTGNVLDAGNDHLPLPPASLSKVLTALAAIENLPADAQVPVSARAAAVQADKLYMKPGQVWTLDQMLHALLISSANDAAYALAERTGFTIEGFQRLVALTAANLGMTDSPVFLDPAGLDGPEGIGGGNLISARDLAIAARALLNQPVLAGIVALPLYSFIGGDGAHHRLRNHNAFFLTTYPGAIGVKTGFTDRAGNCLIAAARFFGRTMLVVVLRDSNPDQTAKQMLDKGFATPVAAEPTADRLPAVHLGPATPPTPPPTTAPTTAPPGRAGSPPSSVPAVAPVKHHTTGSGHDRGWASWTSGAAWWRWAAVAGGLVVVALSWRAVRRRRRRRRIFARR